MSGHEFERKVPKPQWTFVKAREITPGVWDPGENPTREPWDLGKAKELLFSLSLFLPHLHQALGGLKIIFKTHVLTLTCPHLFCPAIHSWDIPAFSLPENFAVPQLLPIDVFNSSFL